MKIFVGIPAYNEEKNIGSLIVKLREKCDGVIVCNDGSTDLTGKISEQMGAIVINHSKNMGYGAGIRSIFLKARELNVDVLVTFDADGQHRLEDISVVLEPIINKKADIVIGSRFLKKEGDVPKYREIGIKTITKLTNASIREKLTDSQSGFRAYSKNVIETVSPSDSGMGVSTEILIKSTAKNFKIIEVPIIVLYEGKTSTQNPVSHGASVILSTIKYTSIEHPLKFYGISSLVFLITGLTFVGWSIMIYSEQGSIITNITLIGIGCTLIGIVLLITAILLYSLVSVIRETSGK